VTNIPVGSYDLQRISYAWSPEGDRLIYPAFDKLFLVNVAGTGLTELAQAPVSRIFEAVEWSRYNDHIIVRTQGPMPYQNELYRYDLASGNLVQLLGDLPGTIGNPSLSLDGGQILYTLDLSELEVPSGRQNNACVFMAPWTNPGAGVNLSSEKEAGFNDLDPQFTPTEAKVILTQWSSDQSGYPSILTIAIGDEESREVLVENGRMADWNN
jgi:TolB protein